MRTRYGRIAIAKVHPFSQPILGSRRSPYLQAKLVYLGSEQVFARVPEVVASLLGIEVSTSQVYRRCQAAAQALLPAALDAPSPELAQVLDPPTETASGTLYGMVDGSMLFTDAGWKEVKVGRVFAAGAATQASEYVAQLGPLTDFTPRFEQLLPPQSAAEKVFVTDGALWIERWVSATYPQATQILDFFHVSEKLAAAAQAAAAPARWYAAQYDLLWQGQSGAVEQAVAALAGLPDLHRQPLLGYLRANHSRMRYDLFRARGLVIGSGAIEAAHRTLLQVRMKRSGQRWSEKGANHLIRLRSARLSQKNYLLENIFKNPPTTV